MINQLDRIGRGLKIMTRLEQMLEQPAADLLLVDEFDETLLDQPYAFMSNSNSQFKGIWNWSKYQVIGLSATVHGEVQEIFEDVIVTPDPVSLLQFKSEYEYVTKNSTINALLQTLPKDENILNKIIS